MLAGFLVNAWRARSAPAGALCSSSGASAQRGVVVNVATQDDDETVSFRAKRFDRARGATIYTLNLPDELALHASAASDLARLCALAADGRLDGQAGLECSWRQPGFAIDALLTAASAARPCSTSTDRLSPRDG